MTRQASEAAAKDASPSAMNSPVGGDAHGRPDTPLQFCGAGVRQDDDGRHRHDMTAKPNSSIGMWAVSAESRSDPSLKVLVERETRTLLYFRNSLELQ